MNIAARKLNSPTRYEFINAFMKDENEVLDFCHNSDAVYKQIMELADMQTDTFDINLMDFRKVVEFAKYAIEIHRLIYEAASDEYIEIHGNGAMSQEEILDRRDRSRDCNRGL